MKQICLSLLILTIALSCNKNKNEDLYLHFIGQGNLYGNGAENIPQENQLIKKEKDWEALLDQINRVNNESQNFTETEIDFKKYMIVACFDKVRPSGGYAIEAVDIAAVDKDVEITLKNSSPLEIAASVITQPFYIAKIPKTKSDIHFK